MHRGELKTVKDIIIWTTQYIREHPEEVADQYCAERSRWIQRVDKDTGEVAEEYCSVAQAARANNIKHRTNIATAANNFHKKATAGGYCWKWKE